ncbi:glutathione-regulated potassium-efflux system ancillary protein kefF [Shigella dysenteriae 225-75]|nr:glutathione-regulated potassium-efflux system ancillary protein kefF [Shigella dysenteriae 225-75]
MLEQAGRWKASKFALFINSILTSISILPPSRRRCLAPI